MAGNSEVETLIRNNFKHTRYYASSGYLQVLQRIKNCRGNLVKLYFSDAQRQLTSQPVMIYAFMYVLVTYKNEDDQMKNQGITLYSYILDAQG